MTAEQMLYALENEINAGAISALERAREQAAQAPTRITKRIVSALDDYPQDEAEAKWAAVLRKDTQLTVDFQAGTMTLYVAGTPLFTCPAAELYGPNYAEVLAALVDGELKSQELSDA
jgi:hypothetical protein